MMLFQRLLFFVRTPRPNGYDFVWYQVHCFVQLSIRQPFYVERICMFSRGRLRKGLNLLSWTRYTIRSYRPVLLTRLVLVSVQVAATTVGNPGADQVSGR